MIYLTLDEVILLQQRLIDQSGGRPGILDLGMIDSAVAQPQITFGGIELLPTLEEKAAALAFSLALNHGFHDGNKRIAHLAMETFLVLNGFEIVAPTDEQERLFLNLAGGAVSKDDLADWVRSHVQPLPSQSGSS